MRKGRAIRVAQRIVIVLSVTFLTFLMMVGLLALLGVKF